MNNARSKSGLFLIELLIVITVFAVCAAICVRIFAAAHISGRDSRDVSQAINIARNAAEGYKATGDMAQAAIMTGGSTIYDSAGETTVVFHHYPSFYLRLTPVGDVPLPTCVITVERDGDVLVRLTASSRVTEESYG